MESCRLQSSVITTASTSLTKNRFLEKSSFHGQVLRITNVCKSTFPHSRKIRTLDVRAQASGITKSSSGAVEAAVKDGDLKDQNLAFVAGATGRVGSRAVRELIKLGFRVRAGVRSAQRAQTLVQSVKEMKLDVEEDKPVEKLEIVECDLEKPKDIGPALGNASVVLCCIGASEKEVFDITGPYRIDYQATKNLIDAAAAAKVNQFIMVSSLGTNKVGFPAAILNLFWGVLIWKRKAEEALIASGLPYTIVRPGGMERPTDAFKETHNLTLSKEDTLFGGLVSNLQVAELMAFMAKNPGLSYCKVVEVIAETTAPLTPMDRLLSTIPSQRVQPKESYPPAGPEVAQAEAAVTEAPVPPVEKESSQAVIRPLSPYTAYDDLRPPTSPTPSPPSAQKQSHSPVDAVPQADTSDILTISSAPAPSIPDTSPAAVEAKTGRPLSPYVAYDDLKPPTSPSPTPSVGSLPPTTSTNGPPVASTDQHHTAEPKPRPLSPYPMYEDLKPPTSPTPSPRN